MALVMDFGGGLARHHLDPAETELAELLGLSTKEQLRSLLSEYTAHGRALRQGRLSEARFWERVFRLAGRPVDDRPADRVLTALWARTYELDRETLRLFVKARRMCWTGILSNVDPARNDEFLRNMRVDTLADFYLPSFLFDRTKSDDDFWQIIDSYIRQRAGEVAVTYVDDREEYARSARSVGWDAVVVESRRQVNLWLAGFIQRLAGGSDRRG